MSSLPSHARAVVIGCGIVGNSRRVPPHRPGLVGCRPARQGPAAEPRRLDRARLELHLPGRPLEGDDAAHAREHAPIQGDGRVHRVRRHRGRAHGGAHAGADSPRRVREGLGDRAGVARDAGGGEGARPVHRRVRDPGRLLHAVGRRRRLPASRDDHARARSGVRQALGLREHRGARDRRRGPAAFGGCERPPGTSRPRWS